MMTNECVAHDQVPALTRYLRLLTFSSTIENDHPRKRGRKRVRLARARVLARDKSGTLERLEMAAQEPGHLPDSTGKTPGAERRGAQRRFAVRRQTRARGHAALF